MNRDFWKKKSVFITGHTGFKGGWLTCWLTRLGARVTGYSLEPPSKPNFCEQAGVETGITARRADIRSSRDLASALEEAQPEIVFHLAAQSLVRRSYDEPLETYSTNVVGTACLLDALRSRPEVRAVVSVTSDKCYQNREWDWGYREDDPLGGRDPYSSSKAAAELVTAAYRASYFSEPATRVAVATARAGNVIGGGDWAEDRLIPDLVRGFSHGETVAIRSPRAIRPWQHVVEPLRGYLMLAERLWNGEREFASAWNFGPTPEDEKPVSWIADQLAERWGDGASWRADSAEHPPEATFLKLETAKARSRLGWRPVLQLGQALEWIVDWHRAALSDTNLRAITDRQLEAYEKLLADGR